MEFDRYEVQARVIADELLDLLTAAEESSCESNSSRAASRFMAGPERRAIEARAGLCVCPACEEAGNVEAHAA
jgi:hypothetical protein